MPQIRPSRGTHIMLSHDRLPVDAGAIVPAGGGRTIFALPWLGRTLVGTTERDHGVSWGTSSPTRRTSTTCSGDGQPPVRDRARRGDVAGAYAGVRPLVSAGDPKRSVDISRKAELYETVGARHDPAAS